ncbi:AtzG-like protein, partial [Methylobacterium radiotolerans]
AAAAAALLGLTLDPAWIAPVTANLRVLAAAAELVEAFPLADEIDAAPRFEA